MMHRLLILLAVVASAGSLCGQTSSDLNEGAKVEWDAANVMWRLKWWGKTGNTYFIQHSQDLLTWNWFPVVETGSDAPKEYGLTITPSHKAFLRLKHTSIATTNAATDDFDGDGVGNLAEVQQGSSPFEEDSDGDGVPDGDDPQPTAPNKPPVIGEVFQVGAIEGQPLILTIPIADQDSDAWKLSSSPAAIVRYDDFTSLPSDMTLRGTASLVGGVLRFTTATNGQQGSMLMPGPKVGEDFKVSFDLRIYDRNNSVTQYYADGFAFAAGPFPDVDIHEAFVHDHTLTIQFDTYGNTLVNGYEDSANTIEIWYGSTRFAKASVALRSSTAVPVEIIQRNNGRFVSVTFGGQPILTDVEIPRSVLPSGTQLRYGFGARTGGRNDDHSIDNLRVWGNLSEMQWTDTGTSQTTFAPAVAVGQKLLRLTSPAAGLREITLVAEDALGLASTNVVRVAFNAPVSTFGDSDGDGLSDAREATLGTSPTQVDTNGDGLWDAAAISAGISAASGDVDGDGLGNAGELIAGTNPFLPDTDGDEVDDAADAYPLDPSRSSAIPAQPSDNISPGISLIEPAGALLLP